MKEDLNEYQTDESGFRARFDVFFKTTFRNAVGDFIKKEILRSRREELYGIICPYERCTFDETEEIEGADVYEAGGHKIIVSDERLSKLLDRLTKRRRDVFLLTTALEYSYRETAAILGISMETVKSAKTRALRDIRRMMAENES